MDIKELLAYCDHTLLRVDCTEAEIRKLCDQAIKYGCASVCIPPCHVPGAKRYVGDKMKICTVIGFPNGYMSTAAKAFEAADAVANGADEIDMVINLSMVKDGCWEDVAEDIKAVRRSCLGKVLKVIIECCLLTDEEKMRMCTIVSECGADFIKTSTGFSKGGATRHDVELLRRCSCVVYDDLIDPAILDLAGAEAERIYMGKRSGRHSAAQAEISALLVEKAQE